MKSKKIILSMVIVLIFIAGFLGQTVLANSETGTWKFTLITKDNNSDPTNNTLFRVIRDNTKETDIAQIGAPKDDNDTCGVRELNKYCAKAGVGFVYNHIEEDGNFNNLPDDVDKKDLYTDTYNMRYDLSNISESDMTAINNIYNGINNFSVKRILALADLFYLEDDDEKCQEYVRDILVNKIDFYDIYNEIDLANSAEETYQALLEDNALITAEQIRAVQQAALWHFTNDYNYSIEDSQGTKHSFLYFKNGTDYSEVGGTVDTAGYYQDKQAYLLYNYFVSTTLANENKSTFLNKVYLYEDTNATDEQPILEIQKVNEVFDLALRKYITAVGNKQIKSRVPDINTQTTLNDGQNTAEYKHKKDPVTVVKGNKVTYTITIYNEGNVAGRATEIIDQLPAGVSFNNTETTNTTKYPENNNYTFEELEGNKIKITNNSTENLPAYDFNTLSSTSVKVVCDVTETPDTDNEKILTNIAYISKQIKENDTNPYAGTDVGYDRDSAPGDAPSRTASKLNTTYGNNYDENNGLGYTGKENITTKNRLATETKHYEGLQDDDDFEKVVIAPQKMDLALRKFITKIGDQNITDRIPQITGQTIDGEDTTAEKTHPKNKLPVAVGQSVVYTIRVYNEGTVNGYATEVTDYLPDGLSFKTYTPGDESINDKFGWVNPNNDGKTIKTNILAEKMLTAVNRDYSKFNADDAADKYYRDLQIECVVEPNATSNNLKNIAAITDAEDVNGNKVDEDSEPEEIDTNNYNPRGLKDNDISDGKGEQDDDDFEDLKLIEFDLALRKYITAVGNKEITNRNPSINTTTTLENSSSGKTTAEYKHKKDPVKVQTGNTVTYTITVYNEGQIAGKATEIIDQLPAGVSFNNTETTNTTKYPENNNYTFEELEGNKIKITAKQSLGNLAAYESGDPDSTSIKVVCDVKEKPDTDKEKILTNIAWISKASKVTSDTEYAGNEIGYDRDSAPGNYPKNGDSDYSANDLRTENSVGYTGKETITTKDGLKNSEKYYEGLQDDDDFEKIIVEPKKFDLALRKFITKVGNKELNNSEDTRQPEINGNAIEGENTTAEKVHRKDKVGVTVGQNVIYTIRVYNEGYRDGYATEVTDYLPEGLDLVSKEESTINSKYNWDSDQNDIQTIRTDYLANKLLKAVNGNFEKFTEDGAKGKYYEDLEVECKVNEKATAKNLRNIAAITKAEDEFHDEVKDEDSKPEEVDKDNYKPRDLKENEMSDGKGEEDDDDFEDLKLLKFDLAIRKYIVKVENKDGEVKKSSEDLKERNPEIDPSTIANEDEPTATYKHRKDPVVVKSGDFVYYNLTVYNEGDIEGYASKITDTLPTGTEFVEVVAKENENYYEKESYDKNTNVLVLKNTENIRNLAPYTGEEDLDSITVTIKCKVTVVKEEDKDKIYTNIAWISEDHNDNGATDRDSQPSNHPEEDKLVTNYDDNGYIGNKENKNKDLTDRNEYFKGEQDDDDFEKIIIYKEPEVHKGVKDVKNQDSGYNADEEHEWVINSSLPLNIADYKKYVITDEIDYRLNYKEISEVNIIDASGKKLAELKENEDYVLEYKENTDKEASKILKTEHSGKFTVTIIDAKKSVSDVIKENAGNIIEVKFKTTFATDKNGKILAEIIGKEIPNKARLEYTNESGEEGKPDSEEPEVHTGGVTLFKYKTVNGKKVALKDAEFEVFRNEEDAKTRATEVKEEKEESSVKAIQTAKSGKDGLVEFIGLEYGEDAMDNEKNKKADGTYIQGEANKRVIPGTKYWIVETKAPKGYKTITEPIEVLINNDTYKEDVEVLIKEEESKETSNRLVENVPLNFDLALRKFITQRNETKVTTRVPEVKYEDGKITYDHTKEPVSVVNGDVVTYTLRIFNEGQINGYANVITDDIPEGLEFLPEHNTNKEYRWVMYEELKDGTEVEDESKVVECKVNGSSEVKKYIETKDVSKAVIIRTDYLSLEQGKERMTENDTENPNLLKAFKPDEAISDTNPDYKDIKASFRVIEPNGSKRILINYAQISDDSDEDGDEIDDIDSTPDEWNDGEDDQDIEKVRVPEFDLALRKWVTHAIVIEDGKETVTETGHDPWDQPEEIVKVELHRKKLSNVTVKFKYSIRIYNEGQIDGYAKEITDYVPEGLKFVAEDNPGWTDEGNNVISTRLIEGTLLKAGEEYKDVPGVGYADVEVVLTWINGNDNLGVKTNIAEISEDYNDEDVPDKDSVPDNQKPGEDDIDDAPVMLSISTGMEITFIVLGTGILVAIAGGIFLIKKYVL